MHSSHECSTLKVIFINFPSLLNHSDLCWFKKSQLGLLMFTLWTVGQIVQSSDVPTRALAVITYEEHPRFILSTMRYFDAATCCLPCVCYKSGHPLKVNLLHDNQPSALMAKCYLETSVNVVRTS